jgi:hypothetical protein
MGAESFGNIARQGFLSQLRALGAGFGRSFGGEMESQELELEAPQVHTPLIETREPDDREAIAIEAPEREPEGQQAPVHKTEAHQIEAREESACQSEARQGQIAEEGARAVADAIEAQSESSGEEDETQLAAIRELMQRAFARGNWLTLGEIAEVTEFAEASISAQLRHLRKPHHGMHRVEKRRRRAAQAAEAGRIRDGRRGPVVWEYRVVPKRARGMTRGENSRILHEERAAMPR